MHLKKCFVIVFLVIFFFSFGATAQTCTGSLGDPIVNVDFGSGSGFGPALSSGTTSSLLYQAATCPVDGNYSIVNYTSGCWPNDVVWHSASDHTGNGNGYYMLINASNQPSNFYIQTIDGLCAGTNYQFAAWLLNMCSVTGIRPNITFTIEKTDGTILGTYDTGDIPILNPVRWSQYGFYFTTPPAVSSVVLRMRNNAPGGVGNDLGLDDITFRPAGPAITTAITGNAGDTIDICIDDTRTFQLNSTVENCYAATAYQWQISAGNGNVWNNIPGETSNSFTRLPTPAGKYMYRLTVAEAINIGISTCRISSAPISINVHPKPQIGATNNAAKCTGDRLVLNAAGGSTYNWSGPNGFTNSGSEVVINNVAIAASGKYFVTAVDSFGCSNIDSTIVSVYARPVAAFNTTTALCENTAIGFVDRSASPGEPLQKWNWDFGDNNLAFIQSPAHVYTDVKTYNVSLVVENTRGCISDTLVQQIVVHPLPVADFSVPPICLTDAVASFTNRSSISDGSESQFIYNWNFGDGNAVPPAANFSTLASPQHRYGSTGVYPVKLSVISKDGCARDTLKNFTVNGAQPVAKFVIDSANVLCSDKTVTITDSTIVDFGSIIKVEIYWDPVNQPNEKITDRSPTPGKKYTHTYASFSSPASKQVRVRMVVYSGISCVDESIREIRLLSIPAVVFTAPANVCNGAAAFRLTQALETSGLPGTGNYNGSGITGNDLFDPAVLSPGRYPIQYNFLAQNGCSATDVQNILVLEQPVANAGPDRTMIRGGSIQLAAKASGNDLRYEWTPVIAIDNNDQLIPTVSPALGIIYSLKVSTPDGCAATDEVIVTVINDIYIPTAFSPNNDGLNDVWRISFLDSYNGATIEVFNRYGELVYRGAGAVAWDGRYKGKLQPAGSYTWILKTGAGTQLRYGMVTIVL